MKRSEQTIYEVCLRADCLRFVQEAKPHSPSFFQGRIHRPQVCSWHIRPTTGIPCVSTSLTDHETARSAWGLVQPYAVLTQGLTHDRWPPNPVQRLEMRTAADGAVEE